MDKYYITHSAVSVRVAPAAEGKIVDVLKPNSIIRVVEEKNGWFKTISGRYILHGEYIEPLIIYNKRMEKNNTPEKIIQIARPKARVLNITPRATIDDIKDNSPIKVTEGLRDVNGTFVPDLGGVASVVPGSIDKENGTIKITGSSGQQYTVKATDVEVSIGGEFQEVEQTEEEAHKSFIESQIEQIRNFRQTLLSRTSIADANISNIRSVFGMPYQFTSIVDNRLDYTFNDKSFGRKYAEKIVGRAPVMMLQAGIPEFLQGYSDDDKSVISSEIMKVMGIGDSKDSDLQNVVNQSGRYYALRTTPDDYFRCVNPMCRAVAMLLGLGETEITINNYKADLENYYWENVGQNPFIGYNQGCVSFYINSDAQIQETFSNGTTQSQMANRVNQLGALGQEVQFLLGGVTNTTGFDLASYGKGSIGADGKTNFEASNGIIDNLIANAKTLIAGGKMIFPEIWSDSQFMRSYNVTLKFDSPDCDNLSIYLNVLVPFCHILGFIQPRRVGSNVYISPFLVRAYYKSMFHIDMGIITECSVTKGDVGAWNQNGLPTQITVQLTIKDLYNVLSMSLGKGDNDLVGNPAQLDYLANMCGVNIAAPDLMRTLQLWWLIRGRNRVTDNIHSLFVGNMQEIYRRLHNLTTFRNDFTM